MKYPYSQREIVQKIIYRDMKLKDFSSNYIKTHFNIKNKEEFNTVIDLLNNNNSIKYYEKIIKYLDNNSNINKSKFILFSCYDLYDSNNSISKLFYQIVDLCKCNNLFNIMNYFEVGNNNYIIYFNDQKHELVLNYSDNYFIQIDCVEIDHEKKLKAIELIKEFKHYRNFTNYSAMTFDIQLNKNININEICLDLDIKKEDYNIKDNRDILTILFNRKLIVDNTFYTEYFI
jgi:hypothetical protein